MSDTGDMNDTGDMSETGERAARAALVLAGLCIGLFGAYSLLRLGVSNLAWSVGWLAGGVFLHDAVLAPVVLGLCAAGTRLLPGWARAPVATGAVVLGSLTLLAVPVLGRFGALDDNPTLLDRSYGVGWLVVAGVVAFGVAVSCLVMRHGAGAAVSSSGG